MTNREPLELFNAISNFTNTLDPKVLVNRRGLYGIDKNSKIITPIIEDLKSKDIGEERQKYVNEFLEKRQELVDLACKKDEEGKNLMVNESTFDIKDEAKEELDSKVKELSDEYMPIIKDLDDTWIKVLDTEVEGIEFYKIKEEWLPEIIAKADYDIFKKYIIDEDGE